MKTYGYCRVSTQQQSIDRQRSNILAAYPDAIIFEEKYTGTKVEGRKQFEKLLKLVKAGDAIIFDEVSRMSRNAADGVELYERLHSEGVKLVFIKEPHINTDTYDNAAANAVPMTGTSVDIILTAVNEYMKVLRKQQIELAFAQAEKEVQYLRRRTREGIAEVKKQNALIEAGAAEGEKKQIGGSKHRTPKNKAAIMDIIVKRSNAFNGTLKDDEVMALINRNRKVEKGISRNTYYKYKRELMESKGE